jgi:hypothetical protein
MRQPPDEVGDGLPHGKPANKQAATTRTSSPAILAAPNTGRRYWARRMIDKAQGAPLPVYGDATWLTLPEADPVKVAAVIVAAEAWATDGDNIPGRLAVEVASSYVAHKQAEDEDYQARAAAHRESNVVPFNRRRRQSTAEQIAEARQPRPGDNQGRGSAS